MTASNMIHLPWAIMGDFNDISTMTEKHGGRDVSARCKVFSNRINACNLFDIDIYGPKFTWRGQETETGPIRMCLDRALANQNWRLQFKDARVNVLHNLHGDHNPLLLLPCVISPKGNKPFSGLATWTSHTLFHDAFITAWRPLKDSIVEATDNFKKLFTHWNETVFGNISHNKRRTEARILGIQKLANPSAHL